jgi:hypothetical protein
MAEKAKEDKPKEGQEPVSPTMLSLLSSIPQWFALYIGLAYATGYVVEVAFLGRLGISIGNIDWFKVRFIHVGTLLLLFEMSVIAPLVALLVIHKRSKEPTFPKTIKAQFPLLLPRAIIVVILLLFLYTVAIFCPPGYAHANLPYLVIFVGLALFPFVIIRILCGIANKKDTYLTPRYVVLGSIVLLIFLMFADLCKILAPMVKNAVPLLVLMALLLYLIGRVEERARELQEDPISQIAVWIPGMCLLATTYFLSVLAFANGVFPYIPSVKGGGDYELTPIVLVRFKQATDEPSKDANQNKAVTEGMKLRSSIPPELSATAGEDPLCSRPVKIIEQTEKTIYVADPYVDPDAQRATVHSALSESKAPRKADTKEEDYSKKWGKHGTENRPRIFEISQDSVACIIHYPLEVWKKPGKKKASQESPMKTEGQKDTKKEIRMEGKPDLGGHHQ